jgi:hypothetical protein
MMLSDITAAYCKNHIKTSTGQTHSLLRLEQMVRIVTAKL